MIDPVIDPMLGVLRYDAALGWYEGEVLWCGAKASISLSVESADELPGVVAQAHTLLDGAVEWQARILEAAVRDLLDLKNGEWHDPEHDAAPCTREAFVARLTLEGITIFPDGDAEFYFEDGGLFFGHTILVAVDSASGDITATLAG